jgi:hypothetical protein
MAGNAGMALASARPQKVTWAQLRAQQATSGDGRRGASLRVASLRVVTYRNLCRVSSPCRAQHYIPCIPDSLQDVLYTLST